MNTLRIRTTLRDCWKSTLLLGAMLVCVNASASELTIPNSFMAGTAAVADDVNANFDAVATAVNDNDARITAMGGEVSTADTVTFQNADGTAAAGDVVGSGTLVRSASGVGVTIDATMLQVGGAYSVWWIIFNNPEACDPAGCTDADFSTAAVEASVVNATGRVADMNGNATFNAFLPTGLILTNSATGTRQPFGPSLQNVDTAEIHVVVRAHGPASGNTEQISTLNVDCLFDDGAGGQVCFNALATVFPLP